MNLHLRSAKLATWQKRLLMVSGSALWISGEAWLWLHYYGQVQGEFGPQESALEPWMLRLHGAAMQVALVAVGSLLVVHVWRGWSYHSQRILGLSLLSAVAVLTITGYLLYYIGDEALRSWTSIIHWGIGLACLPVFEWHRRRLRS